MLTLIEKDRGMHNDDAPTYIEETVTALYCGKPMATELSPDLEFIDPLVRVHDGPPTLRMFERLHRLFPYTEIRKLELRQMDTTTGDYVFDLDALQTNPVPSRSTNVLNTSRKGEWNEPSPIFAKIGIDPLT